MAFINVSPSPLLWGFWMCYLKFCVCTANLEASITHFHTGDRGCANFEMWLRLFKEWVFEPNCLNWFLKSISVWVEYHIEFQATSISGVDMVHYKGEVWLLYDVSVGCGLARRLSGYVAWKRETYLMDMGCVFDVRIGFDPKIHTWQKKSAVFPGQIHSVYVIRLLLNVYDK